MNSKSLLHYDIVLEKYEKIMKMRKLAKYGNIGPSSLKRMPATNGLLKKMSAPHGDHYYISIQNPTVFFDGAWIFSFNCAKNQKDNFFFGNGGDKRRLSDGQASKRSLSDGYPPKHRLSDGA